MEEIKSVYETLVDTYKEKLANGTTGAYVNLEDVCVLNALNNPESPITLAIKGIVATSGDTNKIEEEFNILSHEDKIKLLDNLLADRDNALGPIRKCIDDNVVDFNDLGEYFNERDVGEWLSSKECDLGDYFSEDDIRDYLYNNADIYDFVEWRSC